MRFRITKTSCGGYDKARFKVLATVEDLLSFVEKCGSDVIIRPPGEGWDELKEWTLEVYDDYRE